jgi:hypothetical protein
MAGDASNPIDFGKFITGEEALKEAATSVRALDKAVGALSKSVDGDSARIKAGFVAIADSIKTIQGKAGSLNIVSDADKKLLSDYIKQVSDLKAAKANLKEEEKAGAAIQKVLSDTSKAATSALKEQQAAFHNAASSGDIEAQKKAAGAIQEIKSQSDQAARAIRGANSEYTAASGSINDLRLKLSAGTAAYNALSKAERDNTEAGTTLRDSNKALSDELKTLEKGIGDTRRNVGNYGDAFRGAAATGILPFNDQINKAVQLADQIKGGLSAVRGGLFGVEEGGAAAAEGLKLVKVGVASTGIGLLVIALTALYEYFTKSDEGAEDLAAGLAYLKGAFSVLQGVAVSAGKELSLIFKDPQQLAKDFAGFLETNLANRVKAVGVIFQSIGRGSFGGALEGAVQLATGVENLTGKAKAFNKEIAYSATIARELSRAGDELENLEIENIARTEKQAQLAAKLLLTVKDRNLTEAKRLSNLDEAGRLETSNLSNALKIENERLRIVQATNKEAVRRLGINGIADDDRRKEQEQIATIARLQGEYEQQQQVIANRRSVLQKTEREEEAKAAKEAREKELEADRDAVRARQIQLERRLLTVQKGSEEELDIQKKLLKAKADLEAIDDKKSKAAKLLLRETEAVDELKLDEEFARRRADAEKKRIADALAEKEREYSESTKLLADYLAQQRTIVDQDYLTQLKAAGDSDDLIEAAKREHEQRLLEIEQRGLDGLISVNQDYGKAISELEDKKLQNSIKAQEKLTSTTKKEQGKRDKIERAAIEKGTALANELFSLKSASLNAQADQEQIRYDNAVKAAGANTVLLAQIEADHAKKLADIRRKQAENDKRQALFNIIISTAQAIVRDIRDFGFPLALPFILADTAIGAVQAAVVAAQPIPQYFVGRRGGPAELAEVAERGPELIERVNKSASERYEYVSTRSLVELNAGDNVYTAPQTSEMLATLGLSHSQGQHPVQATAAFAGAAQGAAATREAANKAVNQELLNGINANTAALSKLKQVNVNVHRGSDADVQTSNSLVRYMHQRLFK